MYTTVVLVDCKIQYVIEVNGTCVWRCPGSGLSCTTENNNNKKNNITDYLLN